MIDQSAQPDLIIFSGAYIADEMAAEFGVIPPAFLPLGGKRLFEHQAKLAAGKIYLSLPHDYEILQIDQQKINDLEIKIIRIPAGLSLRKASLQVLKSVGVDAGIEVIFGDTLIYGPCPDSSDLVSFQNDPAHHFWSYFSGDDPKKPFVAGVGDGVTERRILCGHFRFSKPDLLSESLEKADDFVHALNLYDQQRQFKKCMVETWHDFGHLSLFHQSKRNFAVARSFNSIESDGKSVRKSSGQTSKIRAEAFWYENLPNELKLHAPKYLGRDDRDFRAGYRMEYVYLPLLSDLYVFGKLPGHVWSQILSSCLEFLKIAKNEKPVPDSPELGQQFSDDFFNFMFVEKTKTRLADFLISHDIDENAEFELNGKKLPPVSSLINKLLQNIRRTEPKDISFLHGDFFFGNIFFDFRATRVTAFDPRAMTSGAGPTMFGDHRYDLAKLAHSILGAYDHILNARSSLTKVNKTNWNFSPTDIPRPKGMFDLIFETSQKTFGVGRVELLSMVSLLFFSMLPLHADSKTRQEHLFANALRLSVEALDI